MSRDRGRRTARDLNPRISRRRSAVSRARPSLRLPRPPRRLALGRYWRPATRLGILCLELVALIGLVTSPALAVRRVSLIGNVHLSRRQVVELARVGRAPSILLLSSEQAVAGLRSDPYVRTAAVRTLLPDRVDIELVEWTPLAVLRRAGGYYLLNSEGTVLGLSADGRTGNSPGLARVGLSWDSPGRLRLGQTVLPGRLLQDLERMQAAFPGAYGMSITGFLLDSNQKLTAVTASGPRILFGQMATNEQIDSLDSKLASLKSLRSRVDLAASNLDYINLENPAAVTTRPVPTLSPLPGAAATPTRKP